MFVKRLFTFAACLSLGIYGTASAAEAWHTAQIKTIYPLSSGGFVIILSTDAPSCPSAGPGKYLFVMPGENGMTIDGIKGLLATALSAFALDIPVSVAFDTGTTYCYVNRLHVNRN
jgi:hypothetical protein